MAKTIKNRKEFQEGENLPTIETQLPETRFQEDAQVAAPQKTKSNTDLIKGEVAPSKQGTVASAATAVKKKMAIKPTSEAGLGDGKQVGGVPLGSTVATYGVAGVSNVSPAVDSSTIPYTTGGHRPTDRYGKKNTVDNFVLNNTISEQVEPTFEESKDLREAPESTQGYNGIKQFKTARGKKNAGSTPSSLLFERSIDFVEHGSVVHTTGQVIDNITEQAGYPTKKTVDGVLTDIEKPMKKANYLLKGMNLKLKDGRIESFSFAEDMYLPNGQTVAIEQANQNWQIDANNVAHTMVKLQNDLGRETTDKWSPLGYVIDQPYEYNMLMHDIEATTGAIMHAAYRSASHSIAMQINKRGKDGAQTKTPIMELCCGDIMDVVDSSIYENVENVNTTLFGTSSKPLTEALANGSVAAIIKMFDSTSKYTTLADYMNQPRSFKLHLQTCDNNISPLHEKIEFAKALDKVHLFSTEDGQYNPLLPIHVTRNVKLMNPLSLNYFCQDWKNPYYVSQMNDYDGDELTDKHLYDEEGFKKNYNYSYRDIRNNYEWRVDHPLVTGLIRWMLRHETALVKAYGENADIFLPANFGNEFPSLFAIMLCSASQDILWKRNIVMRDVIFAGEQEQYIWDDLTSLKEINPVASTQYIFSSIADPLKLGSMAIDTKIRAFWPEHIGFRPDVDAEGVNSKSNAYLLPWYFNEQQVSNTARVGEGFFTGNHPNCMSMPSIRQGVNHEMIDMLYSISEKDLRLCIDRMVDIPMPSADVVANNDEYKYFTPGKAYTPFTGLNRFEGDTITNMNKFARFGALRYDVQSDGRLVLGLSSESANAVRDDSKFLRNSVYYTTPKELGFIFPLAAAYATDTVDATPSLDSEDPNLVDLAPIAKNIEGAVDGSGYLTLVYYRAYGDGLDAASISRTAALKQRFIKTFAYRDEEIVNYNNLAVDVTGIAPALSSVITAAENANEPALDATLVSKEVLYSPNSNSIVSGTLLTNKKVVSMQNYFWTILQRLFMPINILEYCYDANTEDGIVPSAVSLVDPLEACSYFGFAGCLASDYNQDILERLNNKDQLGIYYIQDDFIKSSLIFRG